MHRPRCGARPLSILVLQAAATKSDRRSRGQLVQPLVLSLSLLSPHPSNPRHLTEPAYPSPLSTAAGTGQRTASVRPTRSGCARRAEGRAESLRRAPRRPTRPSAPSRSNARSSATKWTNRNARRAQGAAIAARAPSGAGIRSCCAVRTRARCLTRRRPRTLPRGQWSNAPFTSTGRGRRSRRRAATRSACAAR